MSVDEPSPLDLALDQLSATPIVYTGGLSCAVARILAEVPEETGRRITRLIDDTAIQSAGIAEVLEAAGFTISQQSVQRHRRRITKPGSGCRCPR